MSVALWLIASAVIGVAIGAGLWLIDELRWDRAREQTLREHPELDWRRHVQT